MLRLKNKQGWHSAAMMTFAVCCVLSGFAAAQEEITGQGLESKALAILQ